MLINKVLDNVRTRHSLTTEYQLAKKLCISHARLYSYRKRGSVIGDDVALVIEKLLNMPEGSLLFEAQAQRTKCKKAAEIMHELSRKLLATAAAVLMVLTLNSSVFSKDSNFETALFKSDSIANTVYYVK
ncbi:MAG: hypothetical protein QM500_04075 [Methylococcales bacterium]